MPMDKIDMYLIANAKYFPAHKLPLLREQLSFVPEEKFPLIQFMALKDPTTMLILSIFLGEFGVDRFTLGDVGLGVGKLLTFGGCLVWWFIDLFLIQNRTREFNFNNVIMMINQTALAGYPHSHGRQQ